VKDTDFDEFLRASHRLFVEEIAQEVLPAVPEPRRRAGTVAAGTRARLAGGLVVLLLAVLVVVQPWRRDDGAGTQLPAVAAMSPVDVAAAPRPSRGAAGLAVPDYGDSLGLVEPGRSGTGFSEQELVPLGASGRVRALLLSEDVYFLAGTARMRPGSAPALMRVWDVTAGRPGVSVVLVGRTAPIGDRTGALALSLARANAVADALVDRGLPRRVLVVEGVGYDRPRFADPDRERSVSISVEES